MEQRVPRTLAVLGHVRRFVVFEPRGAFTNLRAQRRAYRSPHRVVLFCLARQVQHFHVRERPLDVAKQVVLVPPRLYDDNLTVRRDTCQD